MLSTWETCVATVDHERVGGPTLEMLEARMATLDHEEDSHATRGYKEIWVAIKDYLGLVHPTLTGIEDWSLRKLTYFSLLVEEGVWLLLSQGTV